MSRTFTLLIAARAGSRTETDRESGGYEPFLEHGTALLR
jgi:hypothetical protein